MFPDFDHALLASVLDSCGGDHDLAIDTLLEMSNPDYKATRAQIPQRSQSELDEELARRIAAEEEFAAAAAYQTVQSQDRSTSRNGRRNQQPLPENDTFAQVQEQAYKLAEQGKKALFSFAATVKKKIQDFDNGPHQPEDPTYPSHESPTSSYRPQRPYQPQATMQSRDILGTGYDVPYTPPPGPPPASLPTIAVPSSANPQSVGRMAGVSTSPPSSRLSNSPPPPATFDTSRLGLLPKRPVSLVETDASGSKKASVEDEDDLEYVENPFDDKPPH